MFEILRAQGAPFAPPREFVPSGSLWDIHAGIMFVAELTLPGSSFVLDVALLGACAVFVYCIAANIYKALKACRSKGTTAPRLPKELV
eukprot:6316005-Prymnesium_polylepis.3